MNTQQNIAEQQEKFVINIDPQIAKIVSPIDRKELASAYLQMFSGFAWRNWTNKYSLGRAWQTALAQCGAFADTKNKKNPAAKYLKNVYETHKKYWSRVIMTHGARENTINPDDNKIKELRAHGERMVREAMDKINLILARYNERTEELIATQAQTQMHTAAQQQQQQQQTQTPAQADMMAQPMARPIEPVQVATMPQTHPQARQSVAQPAQQSGAFAMVRDNVKRANAAIADKPKDMPAEVAKPAEIKPIEQKQVQKVAAPVKTHEQRPIVHHMPKSVAAPVKRSGALPAVRDTHKQPNVVKSEEKVKEFQLAQKRIEISAEQRAQLQLKFQQQIQMWQIGQFRQNAA